MPGSRVGLYTFKPALNAVNMDGVFKGSVELDAVGGLARSTADLALLSQIALTEEKRNLLSQEGYQKFLTKTFDSLRIGFLDPTKWSLHPDIVQLDEHILKQNGALPDLVCMVKANNHGERAVLRGYRAHQKPCHQSICGLPSRHTTRHRPVV
jgi:Asp-tRNA(Asn)/Glu-tRNA(Gln) amidotransferase A subunit family amidase